MTPQGERHAFVPLTGADEPMYWRGALTLPLPAEQVLSGFTDDRLIEEADKDGDYA